MKEFIKLTEYNWVLWIAGFFALLEFGKWAWSLVEYYMSKIGIETKNMRLKREYAERLANAEKNIQEIKSTTKTNVDMFTEHETSVLCRLDKVGDGVSTLYELMNRVEDQYQILSEKLDKQQEEARIRAEANDAVDRALLRDRLNGGLRFFSQNVDANGRVHISVGDHENMEKMFQEYFNKSGNGTMKQRYETEFKFYIIDDQKFND